MPAFDLLLPHLEMLREQLAMIVNKLRFVGEFGLITANYRCLLLLINFVQLDLLK